MRVFEFKKYQDFIFFYLESLPNKGFGQGARIAKALNINPSIVTQVLKGTKDFTVEQAHDFCEYLALNDLETEYFILLVQHARAGKKNLKEHLEKRIKKIQERAKELKEILPPQKELSEEAKAIFYSQWYYSGARVISDLNGFNDLDSIAEKLQLPKKTIAEVLEFLLKNNLCVETDGKIKPGPQSTHVGANQLLVNRHHVNWRQKSIEKVHNMKSDELFFTSPLTISKADVEKVREVLVEAIEEAFKIIDPSVGEETLCLNIDWFRF